jgi:hypothetical protein
MIKIIKGASEKTIALEIVGGYETKDEKHLEQLFDEKLKAGLKQVNLLIKIDDFSLTKSSWKAMWNDSIYGIKHIKNCGRIAIVGHSKAEEFMVKIDNAFFGSEKAGRIEKYFQTDNLQEAMAWVNV